MATISISAPAARRCAPRPPPPRACRRRVPSPRLRRRSPAPDPPRPPPRAHRRRAPRRAHRAGASVAGPATPVQAGAGPAVVGHHDRRRAAGADAVDVARSLSADADVRDTVARIQELNGLTGARCARARS